MSGLRRMRTLGSRRVTSVVGQDVPRRGMLTSLFVDTKSRAGSPMPLMGNPHLGSSAGIVYVHDVWGLDEQAQAEAGKVANGLEMHVACPDYYRGYVTQYAPDAWQQAIACSPSDVVEDLKAARQHLMEIGCTKIGLWGSGIGSALALISACSIPWDAAVCITGLPPLDKFDFADIISTVPVLLATGSLSGETGYSSTVDYTYAAAEMARHGKNVRYIRGVDVMHAPLDRRFSNNQVEAASAPEMLVTDCYVHMRRHLLDDLSFAEPTSVSVTYNKSDYRDTPSFSLLPEEHGYVNRVKDYLEDRKAERRKRSFDNDRAV